MVAVCDLGRAASGFAPDLSAATSRLRNLRPTADARPLATVVVEAISLVAEQEERRQEVFVFTDLDRARRGPRTASTAINAALAAAPDVRIYVFDAGVAIAEERVAGRARDAAQRAAARRAAARRGAGHEQSRAARRRWWSCRWPDEDGQLEKRGEQIVELDDEGQGRVAFEVADLPLGTHQGSVQLAARRSAGGRQHAVLHRRGAAAGAGAAAWPSACADARFVREALSPSLADAATRFECEALTFDDAGEATLDDFQAVLLLDPGPLRRRAVDAPGRVRRRRRRRGHLPRAQRRRRDGGVQRRGAAATAAGQAAAQLARGNLPAAAAARPSGARRPARTTTRTFPWPVCKVFRFWQFDELAGDAYVVATFANDEPAILERAAGRGRMLTVTTPFSDPLDARGPRAVERAAGRAVAVRRRCATSWSATWRRTPRSGSTTWRAKRRGCGWRRGSRCRTTCCGCPTARPTAAWPTGDDELAVGVTDELGNYRLTAGGRSRAARSRLQRQRGAGGERAGAHRPGDARRRRCRRTACGWRTISTRWKQYVNIGRIGPRAVPVGDRAGGARVGRGACAGESVLSAAASKEKMNHDDTTGIDRMNRIDR